MWVQYDIGLLNKFDKTVYLRYHTFMKNIKYLKDIASVVMGYSFRLALDWQANGNIFVLQASDISDDIVINEQELGKIDSGSLDANIKQNDIVISSRGSFRAAVVTSKEKNILASSSVYMLRLNIDQVIGEYVAIYLNSHEGQRQLMAKSSGAVINSILKKDLEDIEIVVPSLNIQKQIINLYKNNQSLKKLSAQKLKLIDKIIEGAINNLLNTK